MSILAEVRDHLWLHEHREGDSYVTIARRDGTTVRAVYEGVSRAIDRESTGFGPIPVADDSPDIPEREREAGTEPARASSRLPGEPVLIPWFPVASFTPSSPCPHCGTVNDGIRRGSRLVCMVCHRSGLDHLAVLKRPPVEASNKKCTDGTGGGKGKAKDKAKDRKPTRKEKRARKYGHEKEKPEPESEK